MFKYELILPLIFHDFHQTGEPSPVVVSEKADFWRMAHEMTVRHNRAKAANEPIKALR